MNRICEILFLTTWWTYDPSDQSAHPIFVHWFNLFLAILIALFCLRRSVMRRFYPESRVY